MSEERYPDVIELKLKLCFSDAHKTIRKMIKKIEISEEALKAMKNGKCVEGTIHIDKETGKLKFNAWKRKPRVNKRKRDQVICYHTHGWLKMSKNNLKFFASVPKRPGAVCACQAMDDDLQYVTGELLQGIENGNIDSNDIKLY